LVLPHQSLHRKVARGRKKEKRKELLELIPEKTIFINNSIIINGLL